MSKKYGPIFRSRRENRQKNFASTFPPNFFRVCATFGSPDFKACDFYSEGYWLTSRLLLYFVLNYSILVVFIIILLCYILLLICCKRYPFTEKEF